MKKSDLPKCPLFPDFGLDTFLPLFYILHQLRSRIPFYIKPVAFGLRLVALQEMSPAVFLFDFNL